MANNLSNPILFNPRRKIPEISSSRPPDFKYGLINAVGPRSIPRGAARDTLNWLTKGDGIELRRGQAFLGTNSVNTGNGAASGIRKIEDSLTIEHLFGTYGESLKYFDIPTQEWIEVGTNILGPKVVNPTSGIASEIISLEGYVSPAGVQLWVDSPNCAGYFKIFVSNPGSYSDQTVTNANTTLPHNFKGNIKIDTNRTKLWALLTDRTSVYGSYIDSQAYTAVASEAVGSGDGVTKTFNHNLSEAGPVVGGAGIRQTVFAVNVVAGSVTLTDTGAGTLISPDGSTGTINYITGALTVTFNTAPAGSTSVVANYQWEDSTVGGIADFSKASTRTAGQGFIFPQADNGGPMENIMTYNNVDYCMHVQKTWALTIGQDDTTATNLVYRDFVGIPNQRAAVAAGEGIYYIDDRDPTNIKVRLLTYGSTGQQVIPIPKSNNLILENYYFDQCAAILWGDLVLFSCRTITSSINNRVLVYNKLWKSWDILDYNVNCFEVYNGTLVCGDSVTNNFITLFSGFDDLTATIGNYWIGSMDTADMPGLKSTKYLYLEGDIAADQSFDVLLAQDDGVFAKVGTIKGNGDYVDKGQSVAIGGTTLGEKLIGGNLTEPVAYHFEILLPVNTDKYEYIQIKFQAQGIGYLKIRNYRFWDNRYKGMKVPFKYRQELTYKNNFPTI